MARILSLGINLRLLQHSKIHRAQLVYLLCEPSLSYLSALCVNSGLCVYTRLIFLYLVYIIYIILLLEACR